MEQILVGELSDTQVQAVKWHKEAAQKSTKQYQMARSIKMNKVMKCYKIQKNVNDWDKNKKKLTILISCILNYPRVGFSRTRSHSRTGQGMWTRQTPHGTHITSKISQFSLQQIGMAYATFSR
jgi:hypothetical protein